MSREERSELIVKSLTKMVGHHRAIPQILKLLNMSHPADIARTLDISSEDDRWFLWGLITNDKLKAETLVECDPETARPMLEKMKNIAILRMAQQLEPDDAVELTQLLDENRREKIDLLLQKKDPKRRLVFEAGEETAARLMTDKYLSVDQNKTVQDVIKLVRGKDTPVENVSYIYITDRQKKLFGVISLKHLLQQENTAVPLKNIMNTAIISIPGHADEKEAAHLIEKYNLLALPVVNEQQEIMGIITVDDVLDVIEDEAHEEMFRFSGVVTDPDEDKEPSSITLNVRQRLPWLMASCVGGILAMGRLSVFEEEISKWWFLAIFIPIINGMSGNAGIQASVVMIRSLATRSIEATRLFTFFLRELSSGAVLGLIFGGILAAITLFFVHEPTSVPLMVGLSLAISMCISTAIGILIPLIFHKCGVDPSLGASPLVPTVIDLVAVTLFFFISSWFLTLNT